MGKAAAQNSRKTAGRKPPTNEHARFKPGESGNPGGRPKNEVSVTHWLREFGAMSGPQAAHMCATFAKELAKLDEALPIAALAALRAWMALVSEPQPGLLGHVLDRIDGPVGKDAGGVQLLRIEYVNDWRNPDSPSAPASGSDVRAPAQEAVQPLAVRATVEENNGSHDNRE